MSKNKQNLGTTNTLKKIRSKWESLWGSIDKFNQDFAMFSTNVLSVSQQIKAEALEKLWNKLTNQAETYYNTLDEIIAETEQIEKIEVKLPWEGERFADIWKLWTEYLQEQHNIMCGSRTQIIQLKQLRKLSGDNEEKAISIVEWAMTNFYKTFYPINENIKKTNNKKRNTRKDDDFSE